MTVKSRQTAKSQAKASASDDIGLAVNGPRQLGKHCHTAVTTQTPLKLAVQSFVAAVAKLPKLVKKRKGAFTLKTTSSNMIMRANLAPLCSLAHFQEALPTTKGH